MNPFDYCLEQVQRWDRARALALRYAPKGTHDAALALCALNLELAKVAPLASEPTLADIRFLWWQEALEELTHDEQPRNHPVVLALGLAGQEREGMLAGAMALLDGWRHTSQHDQLPDWTALEQCLLVTHGRLASALLELSETKPASDELAAAFGLAWGYTSLRHAFLKSGDFDLLPNSAKVKNQDQTGAADYEAAQQGLADRASGSYEALRVAWATSARHQRQLLAVARLIPLRLNEPERAESLAAWQLFKGQFSRGLPPLPYTASAQS